MSALRNEVIQPDKVLSTPRKYEKDSPEEKELVKYNQFFELASSTLAVKRREAAEQVQFFKRLFQNVEAILEKGTYDPSALCVIDTLSLMALKIDAFQDEDDESKQIVQKLSRLKKAVVTAIQLELFFHAATKTPLKLDDIGLGVEYPLSDVAYRSFVYQDSVGASFFITTDNTPCVFPMTLPESGQWRTEDKEWEDIQETVFVVIPQSGQGNAKAETFEEGVLHHLQVEFYDYKNEMSVGSEFSPSKLQDAFQIDEEKKMLFGEKRDAWEKRFEDFLSVVCARDIAEVFAVLVQQNGIKEVPGWNFQRTKNLVHYYCERRKGQLLYSPAVERLVDASLENGKFNIPVLSSIIKALQNPEPLLARLFQTEHALHRNTIVFDIIDTLPEQYLRKLIAEANETDFLALMYRVNKAETLERIYAIVANPKDTSPDSTSLMKQRLVRIYCHAFVPLHLKDQILPVIKNELLLVQSILTSRQSMDDFIPSTIVDIFSSKLPSLSEPIIFEIGSFIDNYINSKKDWDQESADLIFSFHEKVLLLLKEKQDIPSRLKRFLRTKLLAQSRIQQVIEDEAQEPTKDTLSAFEKMYVAAWRLFQKLPPETRQQSKVFSYVREYTPHVLHDMQVFDSFTLPTQEQVAILQYALQDQHVPFSVAQYQAAEEYSLRRADEIMELFIHNDPEPHAEDQLLQEKHMLEQFIPFVQKALGKRMEFKPDEMQEVDRARLVSQVMLPPMLYVQLWRETRRKIFPHAGEITPYEKVVAMANLGILRALVSNPSCPLSIINTVLGDEELKQSKYFFGIAVESVLEAAENTRGVRERLETKYNGQI